MAKLCILLVCMTGLVTARVLNTQRSPDRMGGTINRIDLGSKDLGRGIDRITEMSMDELMRQRLLLAVLENVNEPLVDEELLRLSGSLVTNQNEYINGIDEDMRLVIELSQDGRLLKKNQHYSILNNEDVRQMVGLQKLFVRSIDWDTFLQNVVSARQQVNGVLFVNALMLAVRDRPDTRMLIMPAIQEILPELYLGKEIVRATQNIDLNLLTRTNNVETARPNLLETIGLGGQSQLNNRDRGIIWPKSHLWMPWQEWRLQMAMRKSTGRKPLIMSDVQDKIVLPLQSRNTNDRGLGLVSEDVGLKGFLQYLINDLLLKEQQLQQQQQQEQQQGGINQNEGLSKIGRVGLTRISDSTRHRLEGLNLNEIRNRWGNSNEDNLIKNNNEIWNRRNLNLGQDLSRDSSNWQMNLGNEGDTMDLLRPITTDMRDFPTRNVNDDRLLHINRRRLFNSDNISLRNGQTVQSTPISVRDQFMNILRENQIRDGRRIKQRNDDMLVDTRNGNEWDIERNQDETWQQNINDWEGISRQDRNRLRQDRILNIMNGRNGRQGIKDQILRNSQNDLQRDDLRWGGNTNNDNLPTTDINNDRLLHVNRRRLSQEIIDDDDDDVENVGQLFRDGISDGRRIKVERLGTPQNSREQIESSNLLRRQNIDDDRELQRNINWGLGRRQINNNDENIKDLPTTSINNDRLLHINRRRLPNDNIDIGDNVQWLQRPTISDGRRILVDDEWTLNKNDLLKKNLLQEERLLGLRRTSINNDRLLRVNRRRLNEIDQEMQMKRDINESLNRRPRDVLRMGRGENQGTTQEVLLHNIQQIVARMNLERISLGLTANPVTEAGTMTQGLLLNSNKDLNTVGQDRSFGDIEGQIRRQLNGITNARDVDRQIADDLMNGENLTILNIIREVISRSRNPQENDSLLRDLGIDLNDSNIHEVMSRLMNIISEQRTQQLGVYKREDVALDGVTINDITVDHLRTLVDNNDIDLINLIDEKNLLSTGNNRILVARQQRLNHKDFTIKIDLTSDRNRQVEVRVLLGPKLNDRNGRQLSLDERRLDFILLDTSIVDLQSGKNLVVRKSRDLQWTAQDTTPFTTIYKRVMMAMNKQSNLETTMSIESVVGQDCRFPHRLVLPRGRINGLPMELLVIVTPIEGGIEVQDDLKCAMGINNGMSGRRSLGFPLDRQIQNSQDCLSLPNVGTVDVIIQHEDKSKMDL